MKYVTICSCEDDDVIKNGIKMDTVGIANYWDRQYDILGLIVISKYLDYYVSLLKEVGLNIVCLNCLKYKSRIV